METHSHITIGECQEKGIQLDRPKKLFESDGQGMDLNFYAIYLVNTYPNFIVGETK